jgi:hypothetical protein
MIFEACFNNLLERRKFKQVLLLNGLCVACMSAPVFASMVTLTE